MKKISDIIDEHRIISFVIMMFLVFGFIVLINRGPEEELKSEPKIVPKVVPKIEEPKTIEEKIKYSIKSKVYDDSIKSISVYGKKDIVVSIDLKYEGGWSAKTLKSSAIQDASSVMKELFTKYPEINRVAIFSYFKMIDNYGKEIYKQGLKMMMDKSTADKINWDNVYFIDFTKVLDDYRELLIFKD